MNNNIKPMDTSQSPKKYRWDDFEKMRVLGQGTYGVVRMVRHIEEDKIYAMKELKAFSKDEGISTTALREMTVLQELYHPNIVKMIAVITKKSKIAFLFEYVEYDLKKFMDRRPKGVLYTEEEIRPYIFQILLGTAYGHMNGVMHRDLKTNNILINPDTREVKIADFGLSRLYNLPMTLYTDEVITMWYRCPELLMGDCEYYTAADVWSIGGIMFEVSHRKHLFSGYSEIDQLFQIFQTLGTPTEDSWPGFTKLRWYKETLPKFKGDNVKGLERMCENFSDDAMDLLYKMLEPGPLYRVEAIEALNHPWFDVIDKSNYDMEFLIDYD